MIANTFSSLSCNEGLEFSDHRSGSLRFPQPWRDLSVAGEAPSRRLHEHGDQLDLHSGSCHHLWVVAHVVPCYFACSFVYVCVSVRACEREIESCMSENLCFFS